MDLFGVAGLLAIDVLSKTAKTDGNWKTEVI